MKMETTKIIITKWEATSQGILLTTNIPARLKPNRIAIKETFISWDKIGNLLFENYTEAEEVEELNNLRRQNGNN